MTVKRRETSYWSVDAAGPDQEVINRAGLILRRGGLVAFPTETVYGLGANALDAVAVGEIFAVKDRPPDNPLIVHLDRAEQVYKVAKDIPEVAKSLMEAYWPGPLTLVLPGKNNLPVEVTTGLDTVAVRIPDHPVALSLIREADVPVAAPSANMSGRPSPTTGEHVREDLFGMVDVIIDTGPTGVGVESTVLDVTGEVPVILRPGGITPEQVKKVAGAVEFYKAAGETPGGESEKPRSPGLLYRHYAPRTPMILVVGERERVTSQMEKLVEEYSGNGKRIGILCPSESAAHYSRVQVVEMGSRDDQESMAFSLYRAMRTLDSYGVDVILAEGIAEKELGIAVMNRLRRAAERIIEV